MARVALLCWEFGEGLGHIVSLLRIAGALRARGWSCVLAIPPHRSAFGMIPPGTDVRSSPRWRDGLEDEFVRSGSSATMADMLADLGLRSPEAVRRQVIGWHLLFAEVMPELVVADHAPGAILAARGRIACAAVGTGFSVPPRLSRFPLLHEESAPADDEDEIVETVNMVLDRFGSPEIGSLSEALRGDLACPCTVPLLDPYAADREEPLLGPLMSDAIAGPSDHSGGVLCYFQPGKARQRLGRLLAALSLTAEPGILLAPSAKPSNLADAVPPNVVVESRRDQVSELLRTSRLVIHAGGHGVAAGALLAGVPQLVLDYDIEKRITGRALAGAGVGRQLTFDHAPVGIIANAIKERCHDKRIRHAARAAADRHDAYRCCDTAGRVAELCDALA